MTSSCPRRWEAEAARDARLGVEQGADFRVHAQTCPACASAIQGLGELGARLTRASTEPPPARVAALRQRVLASADAVVTGNDERPLWPLLAAALALAGIGALVVVVASDGSEVEQPTTLVQALDGGGASWSRIDTKTEQRVRLSDGRLELKVQRMPGGPRFVVEVPDGEIDDIGTTFAVDVRDGITRAVSVSEGQVTLRLRGEPTRTLHAGESWERRGSIGPNAPPPPTAPSPPADSSPPGLSASDTSSPPPEPAPPAATKTTLRQGLPEATTKRWTHSPDILLGAAEDAAYLKVIGLMRSGRMDAAKDAAQDYLRRFPDGFRREEMGRVGR